MTVSMAVSVEETLFPTVVNADLPNGRAQIWRLYVLGSWLLLPACRFSIVSPEYSIYPVSSVHRAKILQSPPSVSPHVLYLFSRFGPGG